MTTTTSPTIDRPLPSPAQRATRHRLGVGLRKVVGVWPTLVAVAIVLVAVWIGSLYIDDEFVFPRLSSIADALRGIFSDNIADILTTLRRYAVALTLAVVAGWLVGMLMGAFRDVFGRVMNPLVSIVQAVPALSWILLSVIWMTSVESRIAFITFMISFPFFVIAVYEGLRDMDKDMLEAIEQFRPTRLQVLRVVLLPQSVVSLIMAIRANGASTLKIMVLAEVLGANNGIGRSMSQAQSNFRIDQIFAWTFVLVLANFVLIKLVDQLERWALRWRAEAVVR